MVNSLSLQWIHPAKPENNLKVEHLKCDHLLLFCVLYNFEYNIYWIKYLGLLVRQYKALENVILGSQTSAFYRSDSHLINQEINW